MAHYFDDIYGRNTGRSGAATPKPQMRRSSTSRSIGARSDFDANGTYDDDKNSIGPEDEEREQERKAADEHMHRYVSEQLERVKSENGDEDARYEIRDEYEAEA